MGAWFYMEPRLRELTSGDLPVRYVGRPERASPAEGSADLHAEEQARIIAAAFAAPPSRSAKRGSRNGAVNSKANGKSATSGTAAAATTTPKRGKQPA